MRIIFVRHGEPDYARDCLTDLGKEQAAAAAVRLRNEGISEIYASPMGRARETASFTAKEYGLPVQILDFMHEISWGGENIPENGHPWTLGDWMFEKEGFDFYAQDWKTHPYFADNEASRCYERVTECFDAFMEKIGYHQEGSRFLCTEKDTKKTIALFSHGGSGACVLARLLSLPFPYVASMLPYDFTSIIILNFPDKPGEYVHPRLELFNDTAHIRTGEGGPFIQKKPDEG